MTWICSHCGDKSARYRLRCPHDGHRIVEDLAGQVIGGRYRLKELIGVGGMDSAVWKAWQMGAERTVAIKILPPADEAAAKRFARGARIAANLSHPNCLVIHDYGTTDDGKLFLVMEFLNGKVLNEVLSHEGLSVAETIHIADQVLRGLEHAHAERAVHRDLKPDNLFLCKKNDDPHHVKILDFGIAKYIEEEYDAIDLDGGGAKPAEGFEDLVTEQRQVCGTPQYMAPEQVVGARVDGRADLYALGCVLYRMLTGQLPFDGKTRYELYQKHLQEPPRPFAEVRPDLSFPERIELIVMKALSKRPQQRFESAAEMREALATVPLAAPVHARGRTKRVALKDTNPQQGRASASQGGGAAPIDQSTLVVDNDAAMQAVMSQVPLKPSFVKDADDTHNDRPNPVQVVDPNDDKPTQVHGPDFLRAAEMIANDTARDAQRGEPATIVHSLDPSEEKPTMVHGPDFAAEAERIAASEAPAPINPTIVPHGQWTLSQQAPPPSLANRPADPPQGRPVVRHPTISRQAVAQATPAVQPAPHPSPLPSAHPSPWPPGQQPGRGTQSRQAPRYTQELLGAEIVRHPASRSVLSAVSPGVPRPTETEPSSVSGLHPHDEERPRWMVPLLLAGAFLLGVGGVSLAISLFGGGEEASVDPLQEAAVEAPPLEKAVAAGAGAAALAEGLADTPEHEPGGLEAEAEAAPSLIGVVLDTTPSNAEVFRGEERLGETPLRLELEAGSYTLRLSRQGYTTREVPLEVRPDAEPDAVVRFDLEIEPPPAAPVVETPPVRRPPPPAAPRPAVPRGTPEAVKPTPPPAAPPREEAPPKPAAPKPVAPKREVRLLEELDAPAPKPPPRKVNLLDDEDPPPKRPAIKTLDEL